MQLKAAYKNNNDWVDVTIAEIEGFKDIEKNKFIFLTVEKFYPEYKLQMLDILSHEDSYMYFYLDDGKDHLMFKILEPELNEHFLSFKDNDSYYIDYDRTILIGGKIHE